MAQAAYNVGKAQGLLAAFKNSNLANLVPNAGIDKSADQSNSFLFQNILGAGCPPKKP